MVRICGAKQLGAGPHGAQAAGRNGGAGTKAGCGKSDSKGGHRNACSQHSAYTAKTVGQRSLCAPPCHCEDVLANRRSCTGGLSCCCGGESGCDACACPFRACPAAGSAAGSRPRVRSCASTLAACSLRYRSVDSSCSHAGHMAGHTAGTQASGRQTWLQALLFVLPTLASSAQQPTSACHCSANQCLPT